jgi:signal transduction histidine kinase
MHPEAARSVLNGRALTTIAVVLWLSASAEEATRGGGAPSDLPVALRLALTAAVVLPVMLAFRWILPVLTVSFVASLALVAVTGTVTWGVVLSQALLAGLTAWLAPGPVVAVLAVVSAARTAALSVSSSESAPAPAGPSPPLTGDGPWWHVPYTVPPGALVGIASLAAIGMVWLFRSRRDALDRARVQAAQREARLHHEARGERARIAHELHDVVAHHISMIAVQAETARLTTPDLHPDGAQRMAEIGDTARAALNEMRRVLGVLREDAPTTPDDDLSARQPQPRLADLERLVVDVRERAGMNVTLTTTRGDHADSTDPGTQLTAYRVVQEGLTNARRHAPGAQVRVEVAHGPNELVVTVEDDGSAPSEDDVALGNGLLGLRERVSMVGGTLSAGPGRRGGFRVRAVLPKPLQRRET